jgi:hypothetical protein
MLNRVENQRAPIPADRRPEFISVEPCVARLRASNHILHFHLPASLRIFALRIRAHGIRLLGIGDDCFHNQALPILFDVEFAPRSRTRLCAPMSREVNRSLRVNRNREQQRNKRGHRDKCSHTSSQISHRMPPPSRLVPQVRVRSLDANLGQYPPQKKKPTKTSKSFTPAYFAVSNAFQIPDSPIFTTARQTNLISSQSVRLCHNNIVHTKKSIAPRGAFVPTSHPPAPAAAPARARSAASARPRCGISSVVSATYWESSPPADSLPAAGTRHPTPIRKP